MAPPTKQHRNLLTFDDRQNDAPARLVSSGVTVQDDKLGKTSLSSSAGASAASGVASGNSAELDQLNAASPIKDIVDEITNGFIWIGDAAQRHLTQLQASLAKADEPSWEIRLGEALLNVALAAGAAAGGEFIAGAIAARAGEVGHEFVKALFEQGIDAGVNAGIAKLGRSQSGDAMTSFFVMQQAGVAALYQNNQSAFIEKGRHQIKTLEGATSLKDGFAPKNVERAGQRQADATRDAWVSYLAQSKFGSSMRIKNDSAATTTNMATQKERDWNNDHLSLDTDEMPSGAPDFGDAAVGHAAGLLAISARLPDISGGRMQGSPVVKLAFLNGLNKENRSAYLGYLKNANIPRQIKAMVDGQYENFTLNIDEAGKSEQVNGNQWLHARGEIGNQSPTHNDRDIEQRGFELLLGELDVQEIHDKFSAL